ncbi:hypothetical protein Leryth_014699 [Lithospermum erythrorhizon]|nr:hypothetical protein Leryth_014699 [Lithospermum erythrorhizon]
MVKTSFVMASSSGNSSENISSENCRKEDAVIGINPRGIQRMRAKAFHMEFDDKVDQLRKENNQILTSINITTEQFLNVEAENSVIRAQMVELSQRLESLNEILSYMNTNNNNGIFENGEIQD